MLCGIVVVGLGKPPKNDNNSYLIINNNINAEFNYKNISDICPIQINKSKWIILYLGGIAKVENFKIDISGDLSDLIITSTDLKGKSKYIAFNSIDMAIPFEATFIKIEAKNNVIINKISIKYNYSYPPELKNNDKIFMSGLDEANPLFVFRLDIPTCIQDLGEKILSDNGLTKTSSAHKKIVAFMRYIGKYRIGFPSDVSLFSMAKDEIGSCGTFSNMLLALAATQGLYGKIIALNNYPKNSGHVVAEININGHWCMYDPTYGSYFTTTPDNKDNPYILSFDELRRGEGNSHNVTHIVETKYRLISPTAYAFSSSNIYQYANPSGYLGADKPFIYPLFLSALGECMIESKDFGADKQGIEFIGITDRNIYQDWTLSDLMVGSSYEFIVEAIGMYGEVDLHDSLIVEATINGGQIKYNSKHEFLYGNDKENSWNIGFVADSPEVKLTLSHNYIGKKYKYIYLKRFELIKK